MHDKQEGACYMLELKIKYPVNDFPNENKTGNPRIKRKTASKKGGRIPQEQRFVLCRTIFKLTPDIPVGQSLPSFHDVVRLAQRSLPG